MLTPALLLSAALFVIGTLGVIVRRNAIIIFLCIELQLNAVNLAFVALSRYTGIEGQPLRVLRHDGCGGRGGRRTGDHHIDLPAL